MSQDARALYDTLARYQWWRRGWSRARPGEQLELRKQLTASGEPPADSGEALDRWLFELAGVDQGAATLDLGCGFGASLLRWVEWSGGRGVGVTTSQYQVDRANQEAARRGLATRCRFVQQDFTAPAGAEFAAVTAIEALGHATDLAAALRNVRRALATAGRFLWVEDLTRTELAADHDVVELAKRWASPPLRDLGAARAALAAAGLEVLDEIDLTARVIPASSERLARRERSLSRWRALVPISAWRRLADAFLGGCALERLYSRGLACYVVFVCEPSAT